MRDGGDARRRGPCRTGCFARAPKAAIVDRGGEEGTCFLMVRSVVVGSMTVAPGAGRTQRRYPGCLRAKRFFRRRPERTACNAGPAFPPCSAPIIHYFVGRRHQQLRPCSPSAVDAGSVSLVGATGSNASRPQPVEPFGDRARPRRVRRCRR